jgi:hypothetical protein
MGQLEGLRRDDEAQQSAAPGWTIQAAIAWTKTSYPASAPSSSHETTIAFQERHAHLTNTIIAAPSSKIQLADSISARRKALRRLYVERLVD